MLFPMHVDPIYTHSSLRNFTYIISNAAGEAWCIDPYDADQVIQFVDKNQFKLKGILNTHEHWDHTRANEELSHKTSSPVFCHQQALNKIPKASHGLMDQDQLPVGEGFHLRAWDTPGHTQTHLTFSLNQENRQSALFTGDTLFNAGVGNCHNGGDPKVLYQSISGIYSRYDSEAVVYPGHDYLKNNLDFSQSVDFFSEDSRNLYEKITKEGLDTTTFFHTYGEEKRINPFLSLDEVQKNIESRKKLCIDDKNGNSDKVTFLSLRALRNKW